MVHLFPVAQLMDHHAVDDLRRRQHQEAVKAKVPFTGTAAPPGLLAADSDRAVLYSHFGSIVPHPLRDVPAFALCQPFVHYRKGRTA